LSVDTVRPGAGAVGARPEVGRRPFYGWYVVAAAGAIAFVAWGVGFWNIGVFLYAFQVERGWSRAALAGGAALFNILAGLTGLVAGRVVDRRGPRPVLIFGGATIGLAMFGLGQVREIWQVYLGDAGLAVGYGCIHLVVLSALLARWFVRRRALAMTLALTGASLGGLVLVPLSTAVISHFGITLAANILALVAWGLVLPVTLLVVRNEPAELGLRPDGDRLALLGQAPPAPTERVWTLGAALRTSNWWLLNLAFTLMLLAQIAYLVHQVSFLSPRLGLGGAALAVGFTTAAGVVGRLVLGWTADLVPKRKVAIGCFLVQAGAVLGAVQSDSPAVLYLTAALAGLTIGNVVALHPLLMAEAFGLRSYGTVYGPGYLMVQLGAAAGPLLVGLLTDIKSGDYRLAFSLIALVGLIAAGLLAIRTEAAGPDAAG
jgi:MFS family permease